MDRDGYADIVELKEYVQENVIKMTGNRQHPSSKIFSDEAYSFYQVQ